MFGPSLITRTLSEVRTFGVEERRWQYHSRSDHHSSISCWAIMFDLLLNCALLRKHVEDGKVGFGLNHELRDFQSNKKKCLDLVICRPQVSGNVTGFYSHALGQTVSTFADQAVHLKVPLAPDEKLALEALPELPIVKVGMVHIALEAKAAMTEFSKARPRLFSELDSSITIINGHASHAVAAALVMINAADEFVSPVKNRRHFDSGNIKKNIHRGQPALARSIIDTVGHLKRRSDDRQRGFDAIGVVVVDMKNDGSPCLLMAAPPAPSPSDSIHYEQLIHRIAAQYAQRFASL